MAEINKFPIQTLPLSKKNKVWRKRCVAWARDRTFMNYAPVRNSVMHQKINYDLLNGKLNMRDLIGVLDPSDIQSKEETESLQHYAIMNSKLNILRGEESKRVFDSTIVITNPNAVSEIEENKKAEILERLKQIIQEHSGSDEEFKKKIQALDKYAKYTWQDLREIRANALMHHYSLEYNIPFIFNRGFMDAMTVGEEIYQCDIVGGEPTIERLNPTKVRIFKSGYSNRIEDADIITIEDYWSPGKVVDTYYDVLTQNDVKHLEENNKGGGSADVDSMDSLNTANGFINANSTNGEIEGQESFFFSPSMMLGADINSTLPYDIAGNVRVIKVFWKSRRLIKKVKGFDPETGEETIGFYPESYIVNTDLGEEAQTLYINEAWEGTLLGEDIFVNMRPRIVQYNRLSNPSRCHFGIIGAIYNLNDDKPFSLVDMMKPYSYLYDVIHDRLNKAMAANWGKIIEIDLALVPKGWSMTKWLYYARINHIAVKDSFKEGNKGAATGKLAGGLNNNARGVIDAETGNYIQQQINLLEFIKAEMAEVAGISKQREGQVSNRETVGGVERATVQSSHITEWLFIMHEDVKKRTTECFIDTAKIAMKGRSMKFQYILPNHSRAFIDIDGDEFAECDYGLVVDNSNGAQNLNSKLDTLAQAALQNQTLSFGSIMHLYGSSSIAEKQRIVESDEDAIQERQAQAAKDQQAAQDKLSQMQMQEKEKDRAASDAINIRDNETKLTMKQMDMQLSLMNASDEDGIQDTDSSREELLEKVREFDAKLKLDREAHALNKKKQADDVRLKEKQLNKPNTSKA